MTDPMCYDTVSGARKSDGTIYKYITRWDNPTHDMYMLTVLFPIRDEFELDVVVSNRFHNMKEVFQQQKGLSRAVARDMAIEYCLRLKRVWRSEYGPNS